MMKITYFELRGLKRLVKRGVSTIRYTPEHDIQVIVGSNGSGKTSLLKELSPLPAKSSDYTSDGYKLIHLDSSHGKCILSSHFSPKQRHSFILNDEECNPGGTFVVQKDLVKRYFNIDEKIQKLLLGKIDFTRMRSEEKKEWFTLLNPTSLSYPLQVYSKLRESHRDINGALKLLKNRLTAETHRAVDSSEESRLKQEYEQTRQFLMTLFNSKPNTTQTTHEVQSLIHSSDDHLARLVNEYHLILKKLKGNSYAENFTTEEVLDAEKLQIEINIQRTRDRITDCYSQLTQFTKQKEALVGIEDTDITQIEMRRIICDKTITDTLAKRNPLIQFPNYRNSQEIDATLSLLERVEAGVLSIISDLIPNPDRRYNSEYLHSLQTQYQSLTQKRTIDAETLHADQLRLTQYEEILSHNQTQCPNCQHQWVRDYNEADHILIKSRIEQQKTSLTLLTDQLASMEKELTLLSEYARIIVEYKRFTRSYPALQSLWDYIDSTQSLYTNPTQIKTHIGDYKHELTLLITLYRSQAELTELNDIHQKLLDNKSNNIKEINTHIDRLNEEIHTLNTTLHRHQLHLTQLRTYKDMYQKLTTLHTHLTQENDSRNTHYQQYFTLLYRDMMNHLIQETQLQLTHIEQQLSRIHSQQEIIKHIEKEINDLQEKEQYLKLALQSMSPVDGLIAKGLYGFINTFISQMNSFISKIWLTPLQLQTISANEDNEIELDYVFSAKIHDGIVPDINECSKGEAEVINRAFILVAMHYLGMTDYPLYLDEFAANMDPKHKDSAFHAITHIMANSRFSQLFIVSHFEKFYSTLRNSDTVVFCSENVYIPDTLKYNRVIHFGEPNEC